jgi:putative tryptophan/tyrosine transport system permease protein
MELWIGALNLGFLYAFMAIGIFITFRIQDFPDITVDGSFTAGAATAAVLITSGMNPFLALIVAFLVGAVAGFLTGIIYTGLKINGLLAGILVMIGLYSINLHIMGRSNIPLLSQVTFATFINSFNPGIAPEIWFSISMFAVMLTFWFIISLFFKTDFGMTMRAAGSNPVMTSANGVSVNKIAIFSIALSNGLVGFSGGLVAQYQGFADIGMGIGTVVIGLASVIIGEAILRSRSIFIKVLSAIVGSIIFRFMIAFALYVGMDPIDLKLLTALFVLLTLFVSKMVAQKGKVSNQKGSFANFFKVKKKLLIGIGTAAAVVIIFFIFRNNIGIIGTQKMYKIGFLQVADNGLLNITRDAFVKEMKKLGYINGKNCVIDLQNANGELPLVNTILDKFLMEKCDIVVTVSTPATQAAINKIKNIPLVFSTIANPFIIGAGTSDSVHLKNLTGVYEWTKPDSTIKYLKKFFPGKVKIGAIWDPAHANSEFNIKNLRNAVKKYDDITLEEAIVSSSSEVYEAASSLVQKNIDMFVLVPDNIVYSAFEAVVKAATIKNIPILVNDLSRINDGALCVYGYDYSLSGIQAAGLVDRILKGENPEKIPFEKYKKICLGVNFKAAKQLGINFPTDILKDATIFAGVEPVKVKKKKIIGIVQFAMEPNVEVCKKGILTALKMNGYVDGENIEIVYKNANADFSMINSIIQDFLRRDVDIIVPLSTPCVQSAVQFVGVRKKPIVIFTYIYSPYKIGAAKTPTDHLPNMTGISCYPPINQMLDLMKEMFPDRKNLGIVWNSNEANSEAVLSKIRPYAKSIGINIIEATVTSPGEILEASRSIILKGADVFLEPGDNTLNVGFDSFVKAANEKNVPIFSFDADFVHSGAIVGFGPEFFRTGFEGGEYLARVLNGENPAIIPIWQTLESNLMINMGTIKKLGLKINPSVLKKANQVFYEETKKNDTKTDITSDNGKKRIALFAFSDNDILKQAINGVIDGLNESGIVKKNNLEINIMTAQGDFALAQSVAHDIVQKKYDYIITISTPALQVTANANKKIPHVFGAVTDPYRMGIAKNSKDHLPNLTGVQTFQPVESTIKLMREMFPKAKKIGMVWNPSEACSEACTEKTREFAKKYNFQVLEANITNSNEVLEAVKYLINKKIDLFFSSGDNTVNIVVNSVSSELRKFKIPYITNTFSDVNNGAFVTLGADYYEVGKETGRYAIKVLEGANPKDLPIESFIPEKIYLNMQLAKEYSMNIPRSVIDKAAKVKY